MQIKSYEVTITVKQEGSSGTDRKFSILIPDGITDAHQLCSVMEEAAKKEVKTHIEGKTRKG